MLCKLGHLGVGLSRRILFKNVICHLFSLCEELALTFDCLRCIRNMQQNCAQLQMAESLDLDLSCLSLRHLLLKL